MMRCQLCGAAFDVEAGFCPHDGTALVRDEASMVAVPPADRVSARANAVRQGDGRGPGPTEPPADRGDHVVGCVLDGRYRIDARIGEGGMGTVYRATHLLIEKAVAVKLLRPGHARRDDVAARFMQEARLASRVKHPNVVDVFDFGRAPDEAPYYVMELLAGTTLAAALDRKGALAPRRALEIALAVANGLAAAHRQGVVHRDLKPDNVFLCTDATGSGTVKIIDFGIARMPEEPGRLTAEGAVLGTPEYMSPEQARGEEVDARSDLYSVGILLFEMLVGRPPFESANAAVILEQHIAGDAPSLASVSALQLPRTEWLLAQLLAKAPTHRPSSAELVRQHLETALESDLALDASAAADASDGKRTASIGSGGIHEVAAGRRDHSPGGLATLRSPIVGGGASSPPDRSSATLSAHRPSRGPGRVPRLRRVAQAVLMTAGLASCATAASLWLYELNRPPGLVSAPAIEPRSHPGRRAPLTAADDRVPSWAKRRATPVTSQAPGNTWLGASTATAEPTNGGPQDAGSSSVAATSGRPGAAVASAALTSPTSSARESSGDGNVDASPSPRRRREPGSGARWTPRRDERAPPNRAAAESPVPELKDPFEGK
ncbi:MAG: hypothetical protein B7733_17730 [Myxococcales bacterium FL481]|nr:MAG: hypothetical protein B7733_17730 [Myxococcales bacterium FL481]